MKNRYLFFKRLFPNYVVLLNDKTMRIDKYLKEFIKNNDINYVIGDNDNLIEVKKVENNNYKYYVMRLFIKNLIDRYKLI